MPFRRLWNQLTARKPLARKRYTRRLRLEQFEPRHLLTGDLQVISAELINFQEQPMTTALVGEQVFVRAEWREVGSPSGNYLVRFSVNGVTQDSFSFTPSAGSFITGGKGLGTINIAGRTAGVTFAMRGGWFAGPGTHTVAVTLDPANSVVETSETNNSIQFTFTTVLPTTLPAKLLWPVGGEQNRDWGCCNYIDVDNLPGTARDYRGNAFGLDGHAGYDIGGVNFARMDRGIPVFAAAAGRVTSVEDGHFDRVGSGQTSSDPKANQLEIDHGNGWSTLYGHMADGLAVAVGDWVTPGQLLGYLGSSGGTSVPHLHWEVHHFGGLVEPGFAASTYFAAPRPYQLDTPTGIKDAGLTNDLQGGSERYSEIDTIPRGAAGTVTAWTTYSHFRAGDVLTTKWIRPNGTLRNTGDSTFNSNASGGTLFAVLPIGFFDASGRWHWVQEINGVEISRVSFDVVDGAGSPEVRVTQGSLEILDERTTPLDFGSVTKGGSPPQKTFAIHNHGFAALNVSSPVMPPGFSLAGAFPSVIAAGQNASVTVQLDTAVAGAKFGEVRFTTNDASESLFNFNVAGLVTGTNAAGTPQLFLPGPAVGYAFGQMPVLVDRQVTLTDSDSVTFGGGSVVVELAGGGTSSDRLEIRSLGDGPGQIAVTGNEIRFGGTVIGMRSGGSGTTPLVVTLNATATRPAVEALLRSIAYSNVAVSPPTRPRYVRFTVTDDTGKVSNQPVKKVMLAAFEANVAPRVANPIAAQVAAEDSSFGFTVSAATFVDDNSFDPTLTYSAQRQGGGTLPGWLLFDAAARRFSGTPGNDDVGSFVVTVTAADQAGLSAADDFQIQVANTNDAPIVASPIPDRSTDEGSFFDFTFAAITFSDIDAGDALTFRATLAGGQPLPAWLSFDSAARRFHGTPTNDDVGALMIRVTATDTTGASIADDWNLTVANVNDPPALINPIPDQVALEDTLFQFAFDASAFADPDVGDALTYSAATSIGSALPAWLTFDPLTRTFSGTPRNGDVGTLHVRVTARDNSQASAINEFSIEVQNVNDAPDDISLDNLSIAENSSGAVVASVTVSDQDADDSHEFTVSDSRFEIAAGQLRLKPSVSLDHETEQTIDLLIRATDNGQPPLDFERSFTLAVADINEFAPQVTDATFTLAENSTAGTVVGTVAASDGDVFQTLSFAITAGNSGETFAISPDGRLTVRDAGLLDFETMPSFQLTVSATDSGSPPQSALATISVNLTDVNEFAPAIQNQTFHVAENASQGTSVGLLVARDDDTHQSLVYSIVSGNTGGAFALGADTGELTVADQTRLDHEAVAVFLLIVGVSDDADPIRMSEATVTVLIDDVNEFSPGISDQSFTVDENSPTSFFIGMITASDNDTSQLLTFRLLDGNVGNAFSLDPQTGALVVAGAIDYESLARYLLTIEVTDSGDPSRSGIGDVRVDVRDVNEFAPLVPNQQFVVDENSLFGTVIGAVTASDGDVSQLLSLTISGGNDDGAFALDPATGQLTVARPELLDHESIAQRTLLITAVDSGVPSRSASNTIVITVADVNESPIIDEVLSDVHVRADAKFSKTLSTSMFHDPDANDELRFTLSRTDGVPLPAWLTFDATAISLSGAAPNQEVGHLELLLTGYDGGTPSLQVSLPFVFHVEANATPWQNTIQPVDVNRDGTVSPLDALLGINALNSNQFVQTGNRLPLPFDPAFASLDVNGDGILSPIDILLVINHLNNSAQPESEAGTLCLPPVISRNRITSLVISRVSSRVAFPVDLSIASEVIDPAVADHIFTGIVADDLQETRIKATHHRLGLHGRHHAKPSTAGCPRKR